MGLGAESLKLGKNKRAHYWLYNPCHVTYSPYNAYPYNKIAISWLLSGS
jgi:hypothetical protein